MRNILPENMRINLNFKSLLKAKIGSWFEYDEDNIYVVEDLNAAKKHKLNTQINPDEEILVSMSHRTWNPFNHSFGEFKLFIAMSLKKSMGYSYTCPNEALTFMRQAIAVAAKTAPRIPPSKSGLAAQDDAHLKQPFVMMGVYGTSYSK